MRAAPALPSTQAIRLPPMLPQNAVERALDPTSGLAPAWLVPQTSPDAPARRLEDGGVRELAVRDLITLILTPGRGRERAGRAAEALTSYFVSQSGYFRLRHIARADVAEVARVGRIGRSAAARLLAGLELGLRAAQERLADRDRLRTARDVYERMRLRLRDLPHEEFWVLVLNVQNEIVREVCVTRGIANETVVHPREVFRLAILESASALVLVHNHPSGEPAPSPGDDVITTGLVASGHTLGICVIDHIIIGEGRYYSYNEEHRLPPAPFDSFAWGKEFRLRVAPPRRTRKRKKNTGGRTPRPSSKATGTESAD